MKQKVVAYITRVKDGKKQLLVNVHRDYPDAGVQVPTGTVETGELIKEALWREIYEESGLKKEDLTLVSKLAKYRYFYTYKNEYHERHVFHLSVNREMSDTWVWNDPGAFKDKDIILDYYWVNLDGEINLEVGQGDYLSEIR